MSTRIEGRGLVLTIHCGHRKRSTRPPAIGTWRNLYGKPGEPPREMFDRRGGAV